MTAGASPPAVAAAAPPRATPQKTTEPRAGSQATKQTTVPAASTPQLPALPPPAVAPELSQGGVPPDEAADGQAPGASSADDPAPAPAAGSAASEQAAAAPIVPTPSSEITGALDGKPAEALPATAPPAGDGAGSVSAAEGLPDRDPGARASPTPADHAMPDAAPASAGPAALAEARDTVALRVAHAAQDGVPTVSIDLHPAELGHVGIELSFHDGGVSVQMTLARHETYEAFSRDRVALEQQLAQAGLSLGSGGLDLRFGQKQDQQPAFAGTPAVARIASPHPAATASPAAAPSTSDVRLNIIA
jgi:flagellar hook-length control protein FliK